MDLLTLSNALVTKDTYKVFNIEDMPSCEQILYFKF